MITRTNVNRRQVLQMLGIGAGAAAAIAWSPAVRAQDDACAAPGDPAQGGSLTVGQVQDISSFDPFNLLFLNYPMQHQLFDRLIKMDHELTVHPGMAETWELSDDGLQITFQLRSGLTFHDGDEVTAEDVVANIERARAEETGGNIFPKVQTIASAEAPDASTVVVNFSEPTPNVFDIFDSMSIADPDAFNQLQNNPVGSGPFTFKEWIPGDQVVFERNDAYWNADATYLDEIIVKPFADAEALTTALIAGQIDAAISVPYKDYQRLQDEEDVTVELGQTGSLLYVLVLNPPDPGADETPLSNQLVRQAINHALDRQTIVDQALFGVGAPTVVPFPDFSIAYVPELAEQYPFDLEEAQRLLDEAGYGDGFELEILAPTSYPELVSMGQILKSDLAKIGIEATITPLESAVWTPRLLSGDYPATFTFIGRSHKDPLGLFDNSPFRTANSAVWPEGDFPEGYAEAIEAASTTIDPEARMESFRQLSEIMLDQSVQLPISFKFTLFGWQNRVQNLDWSPDDEIKLGEAWLADC